MAVYVDDMYLDELGRYGRMKMSHMIADTDEELLAMADRIGVNPRWVQHEPGHPRRHFDIALAARRKAVAAGAIEVTMRQCATMCRRRQVEGVLGTPDEAMVWRKSRTPGR